MDPGRLEMARPDRYPGLSAMAMLLLHPIGFAWLLAQPTAPALR